MQGDLARGSDRAVQGGQVRLGDRGVYGNNARGSDRAWHGENVPGSDRAWHGENVPGGDRAWHGRETAQGCDRAGTSGEVHGDSQEGRALPKEEGDQLKGTAIILPALGPVTADAGLQCGDSIAQLRPLVGDLSTSAVGWWDSMVQEVNAKYQIWLAASPLDRLSTMFPDESIYNTTPARQRMDLRASALLMGALPSSLKEELIACRALTSGRILFRVLQTYQPGGSSERSSTLKQLTIEHVAKDPREATKRLRRWKRHQQRAEELSVTLPDIACQIPINSGVLCAINSPTSELQDQ